MLTSCGANFPVLADTHVKIPKVCLKILLLLRWFLRRVFVLVPGYILTPFAPPHNPHTISTASESSIREQQVGGVEGLDSKRKYMRRQNKACFFFSHVCSLSHSPRTQLSLTHKLLFQKRIGCWRIVSWRNWRSRVSCFLLALLIAEFFGTQALVRL